MHTPKHQAPHEILAAFFKRKQSKNQAYSVRALARDLKKSPSFVSQILNGKSKPSPAVLEELSKILDLDSIAKKQLGLAMILGSDLPKELKESYKNTRNDSEEEYTSYQEANFVEFDCLKHWYYIAILDLCSLINFKPEIPVIARTLGISKTQTEIAVKELFAKGLLQETAKGWKKTTFKLRFSTNASRDVVRSYHRQMIEKSLVELKDKTDPESFKNRLITGLCIAANPKNIERAKLRLEEALFEASQILSEGDCTQLYHINLQLFGIANPEGNKE